MRDAKEGIIRLPAGTAGGDHIIKTVFDEDSGSFPFLLRKGMAVYTVDIQVVIRKLSDAQSFVPVRTVDQIRLPVGIFKKCHIPGIESVWTHFTDELKRAGGPVSYCNSGMCGHIVMGIKMKPHHIFPALFII